jgi:cyclic 2,3-diphosphoglycerate synthase
VRRERTGEGDVAAGAERGAGTAPAALALIDGEHYPPVVRATLDRLGSRHRFVAALFLGGDEKLRAGDEGGSRVASTAGAGSAEGRPVAASASRGQEAGGAHERLAVEFGLPVFFLDELVGDAGRRRAPPESILPAALLEALRRSGAGEVVDLSDEPVLGYRERFLLMSAAAAAGAVYVGADFQLRPQPLADLALAPSLAVIGTGKRVGKTAISGAIARSLAAAGERVVVVAMGRGGPPEPEVVHGGDGIGADELLSASRRGRHAASDHFEDAALAGVTTIGCRRCGGGLAGAAFDSTVLQALAMLDALAPTMVLFEGSGSVVPPVRAAATVCVASAAQPLEYITGYLGTLRLLVSDLLVLTMCEPPFASANRVRRLLENVARTRPDLPVVATVFRSRPQTDVRGRRVAYFTTAASGALRAMKAHLTEVYGAEVVLVSGDLARRPALAAAVRRAQAEADVFLTEIKAAAIDVVAEAAAQAGKQIVFCDNEPLALPGADLAAAIDNVVGIARRRHAAAGEEAETPSGAPGSLSAPGSFPPIDEGRPRHG